MRSYPLIACATLCAAATLHAQSFTTHPCNDNLGSGGPTVSFQTTNGGVSIQ